MDAMREMLLYTTQSAVVPILETTVRNFRTVQKVDGEYREFSKTQKIESDFEEEIKRLRGEYEE